MIKNGNSSSIDKEPGIRNAQRGTRIQTCLGCDNPAWVESELPWVNGWGIHNLAKGIFAAEQDEQGKVWNKG